jgi:hypothetical protein
MNVASSSALVYCLDEAGVLVESAPWHIGVKAFLLRALRRQRRQQRDEKSAREDL